jgi:CubicO group peptidase (beta-lactamase class C family)
MTRRGHVTVIFAVALVVTGCGRPPDNQVASVNGLPLEIAQAASSLMGKYRVPGAAVAHIEHGRLRAVQGFGFTDDTRTNPVEPEGTVFEAASLGKPLFSYAVIQSALAGTIDLDAPVEEYLGSRVASDPAGRRITAAHLLSHSSGLAFQPAEGKRVLTADPGSQWQYSGLGFLVLQQAIEHVSRSSLDLFIRRALTEPLGMRGTSFVSPDVGSAVAIGHDREGREMPRTKLDGASAASSLRTNVVDYARFVERMFLDLSAPSGKSTVGQLMLQPRLSVDPALGLSWGLGWGVASVNGEALFLHWGSNPGFKSLVVGSVDRGLGLIVLTNSDNGLELATALVPQVFGHEYPFLQFKMLHPDD